MLGFSCPTPLREILPERDARALSRYLNLRTVYDLLQYYPRAYSRRGSAVDAGALEAGEMTTLVGTVLDIQTSVSRRSGIPVTRVTIQDESNGMFTAWFYRSPWVEKALPGGTLAVFSGKVAFNRGELQLQHPKYLVLPWQWAHHGPRGNEEESSVRRCDPEQTNRAITLSTWWTDREYLPIYPVRAGITSWRVMEAVRAMLEWLPPVLDPLTEAELPAGVSSLDTAFRGIHAPGKEGPEPHRRRLTYNEALSITVASALRRAEHPHTTMALPAVDNGKQARMLDKLPFALTRGQREVIGEISRDMGTTTPMARLLQGEVGSGKTIVALSAMLQAVDNGSQCALLAPTEVLAAQHHSTLKAMLEVAGLEVSVVLLTGSQTASERQRVLLDVMSGNADIVVGTHALLESSVEFFRLGLAIVDEQHRFGVEQRDKLRMGGHPHQLVMTATPIPRTIAMTVYGDLDVSVLHEVPHGHRRVSSVVVRESQRSWMARIWEKLAEEATAGHQSYVVCPRIDGKGGVVDLAERVTHILPDRTVAILHGRLPTAEKESVMTAFAKGEVDILVSTTVIEVGVDVPTANVMVVWEAEHFGISQLHQLRGRVGRAGQEALCLLHTASTDPDAVHRLEEVARTNDGFQLAELDLRLRREGDVLGTTQSGGRRMRFLSLTKHADLIAEAQRRAPHLVARDAELAVTMVAEIAPEGSENLGKS